MVKFKKLIMFIGVLLVSQIIVSGISSAVLAEDDSFVYGDVNGDEAINAVDFAYMRQHLLGIISEFKSVNGIKAADVDGNGTFNAIDFAVMRKYLLGIIDEFPANQVVTPTIKPTITPTSIPSEFMQAKPSIVDVIMSDSNSIKLSWNKVEGAVSYEVFRNGVSIVKTSDNILTDTDKIEGNDCTYYLRAVNDMGEKSLVSDRIIVNTGDVVINSDTILSENRFYKNLNMGNSVVLDINGYTLDVKNNFIQTEGIVKISSGRLEVGKDYSASNEGIIQMKNQADYVYVGGNLSIGSSYFPSDYINGYYLTEGIFEVKGNFSCIGEYGNFMASGSHKVVLSGDREQIVSYNKRLEFNELEIRNETGVKFVSEIIINKMKGSYKVIGTLSLDNNKSLIAGDVTIDGDLEIKRGTLDLEGYNLKVTGNLIQSPLQNSSVKINGGKLLVNGNYTIGSEEVCSTLQMTNERDYVYVGGDFISYTGSAGSEEKNLMAGTIEVKGDFGCIGRSGQYIATGANKVLLSGTDEQTVYNNGWLVFNELEIKNENGVKFNRDIVLRTMKGNYKVVGEMAVNIEKPITGDVTVDGDLKIMAGMLDLAGYNFKVMGNLTQGQECSSTVKINGGRLEVYGDYFIGDKGYEPYPILEMTNEADYVYVEGDFTTASNYCYYDDENRKEYLSAGIMEVKGDFNSVSYANFIATGTHKVILSGSSVQTINNSFEHDEVVYNSRAEFNELVIMNDKGVKFNYEILIRKMKGNYKVVGELALSYIESPIAGDVTIDGDLRINAGVLDLAGYNFKVNGNLIQNLEWKSTVKVKINGGRLDVSGNYTIGSNQAVEPSILEMTNKADYVYVGGDFSIDNNMSTLDKSDNMIAGVLEVQGDFSCIGLDAKGKHKVILSGEGKQVVRGDIGFDELEISNKAGVEFINVISINKMKGNYKVLGDVVLSYIESVEGDVTVEGNLKLIGGMLDLSGYSFVVKGNFIQGFERPATNLKVNGGKLVIYGNYSMDSDEYDAILQMTNEKDYVYVGGNFSIDNNMSTLDTSDNMIAGVLEVQGDFSCIGLDAKGKHKVILSGEGKQVVRGNIGFNELEISNKTGVEFINVISISKMKGNYKVIGDIVLWYIGSIEGDVTVEGNLKLIGGMLDLSGYSFVVKGNFIQGFERPATNLKVNGGKLVIYGNYSMDSDEYDAILQMTNEKDYVYVGGNFSTDSPSNHSNYLTAGILEVKGDFTQTSSTGSSFNFAASGTHKTILSGDSVQTVTFEAPTTSSFNILKLTKPLDTGYIFNTKPVWKTLEQ